MSEKKQIKLCFLECACTGGYMASGQWRRSDEISMTKDTLKYYLDLARLAEKGKISAVFFADWYAGFEVYANSMNPMLKAGHQVAHMDPLPIIGAMATVTESVGLAMTMSSSYVNPYVLARQFSTLDHLTNGRVAWNVVTSWSKAAANALGQEDVVAHSERYAMADEYMDVVYSLWESSWAPEAVLKDRTTGVAYDGEKIKKINHQGKYFRSHGRNQVHPGPQRTPVIFQAGTSKSGTAFAAKHAEAIFLNPVNVNEAKRITTAIRRQAEAIGRDPKSIKFFPCVVPFIGRTEQEAREKYKTAIDNADPIAGLGQFCGYTGIDLSTEPLDEPFQLRNGHGQASITGVVNSLNAESSESWTPRKLGVRMAVGGLHPIPVGTPEQVADVFEEWISEEGGDCDGFNVASVVNPGSWTDVVELLVPELQRRGIYWTDYDVPGGTFRENLLGTPHLRHDHYGSQFKYPKEGPVSELAVPGVNGDNKRQKRTRN